MTSDYDHPDTDLTDHHGEAEALRRENARLQDEVARLTRDHEFEGWAYKCQRERDAAIARAEAAEAALAASSAPDPAVNAGSCQQVEVRAAVEAQISEGIGAILRKFCDSPQAALARRDLHAMPQSDWNTLVTMLADAVINAIPTKAEPKVNPLQSAQITNEHEAGTRIRAALEGGA